VRSAARMIVVVSALAAAVAVAVVVLGAAGPARWLWGLQTPDPFAPVPAAGRPAISGDLARIAGKAPSVVPFNVPFENCSDAAACTFYAFPAGEMDAVHAYGAIPMLNWSSMSIPLSADQPAFTLARVAGGSFDSYIEQFAQAAAHWGHPFLLRFDWEMNGNWFPWEAGANGNDAARFVAAWRHVHDIFTAAGATNATWVWCPNVDFEHRFTPLAELYPGSAYVNWTCLDGYNMGNLNGAGGWMTFNQIFASSYNAIAALAPAKPMIIGETASSATGGNKAAWVSNLFAELPHYPNIHAFIYFDKYDGSDDWPLDTDPSAVAAFKAGIARPAFTSNSYGSLPDGVVTPP